MSDALLASSSLTPVAIVLSDEQADVARYWIDGRGNMLVKARAGTGKTFLIRQCIPVMKRPVGVVAFGKAIADEVAAKIAADGNKADVATFNSFGFRAVRAAFKGTKMEGKKPGCAGFYKFDVIAAKLDVPDFLKGFVEKAMKLAMQTGIGIRCPINDKDAWLNLVEHYSLDRELGQDNILLALKPRDELIRQGCQLACKAIRLSMNMIHEVVSFADQIYAPLFLNLDFDRFASLATDEAQDDNWTRIEMTARMLLPGGRLMAVGDDMQSIFGFTGAENDALEQIRTRFNCKVFPLTETRRCCKAVVRKAQALCPDFRAHPDNPEGFDEEIDEEAFGNETLVAGQDAIICRNTAPLIKVAYKLIARGVAAHVEGREIATGLVKLIDRWKSIKTIRGLTDRLTQYKEEEVAKFTAAKQEDKAGNVADQVDAIFAVMETLPSNATIETLRNDILSLFADTPEGQKSAYVTLLTAHKAKGREYDRVFGWGCDKYFPSKYAKQDWQLSQEEHLLYVLWTRAKDGYVEVVVE
jgi:DNA helicase-2/ATP-dependent DNA helicase PcrA